MTNGNIILKGQCDKFIDRRKTTGENIRFLRHHHYMRQCDLAQKTFINSKRIGKIENDELSPTIDEAIVICKTLKVSVLALFFNVRLEEINCDSKTGLNEYTIRWLKSLNHNNHNFITILNEMSKSNDFFNMVCGVINEVIKYKNKDV